MSWRTYAGEGIWLAPEMEEAEMVEELVQYMAPDESSVRRPWHQFWMLMCFKAVEKNSLVSILSMYGP